MEKNWYSYKTKAGLTLFYYNSDSGEHIWASGFEPLQCSRVQPEEIPLLQMCRNSTNQLLKGKEKRCKSIGTETEEHFLEKNPASTFVRDIGINAITKNAFISGNDDDGHVDDDDDAGKTAFRGFRDSPPRSSAITDQPLSKTREIVEHEYIASRNHSLVDNLFAMEVSPAISTEDKPKGEDSRRYRQTAEEKKHSLSTGIRCVDSIPNYSDFIQASTVSGCPRATSELRDEEEGGHARMECENESLSKGSYLGLSVGKEGRIYVRPKPEDECQEIMDKTRIKREICEDNDDDNNDDGHGDGDAANMSVQVGGQLDATWIKREIYQDNDDDDGDMARFSAPLVTEGLELDATRIKREICQDNDDEDGIDDHDDEDDDDNDDDVTTFRIVDFLPSHSASNGSGNITNSKPIPCEYCEKSFKRSSHLKRHMLIHTDRKPHGCHICSKSFREANCLKKHMRTHTGEKPYHCPVCNKGFSQSQNLNKHMNIHTGNKPHKCTACGKAFSQHSHLARHKLIHTGEKPYQCTKCGKAYRTSSHLVRHQKSSRC